MGDREPDDKPQPPKGPGDPCPNCGAKLIEHAPVVKTRHNPVQPDKPVELPASKGVAECPRCGYVLTEPPKEEEQQRR